MKISLIVEGQTEKAFVPTLRDFLRPLIPRETALILHPVPQNGRIPRDAKLNRIVERLLHFGRNPADYVIALTDVYPDYSNAAEAKSVLHQSVQNQARFYAHAAQYDFEAWLLPYWSRIQRIAGVNQSAPGNNPESINGNNPPSNRIKEVFRRGQGNYYTKSLHAPRILQGQDLNIAVERCPELKSLVNTILHICGGQPIP